MSKKMLVNIRGCNGAGKSTIPLAMTDDPEMYIHTTFDDEDNKVSCLTVFPTYKWVALGTYYNKVGELLKTGGMDTLKNNLMIRQSLYVALMRFSDYDILMEGVIASTIYSTYVDLFREVEQKYPDRKILILSLTPPIETAIKRVYARNGDKPVNVDAIAGKWNTVKRNVKRFSDAGFTSISVDSSKVPKKKMLKAFLKTVNKYRG